ncbi:MAG: hypothetical protein AAGH43_12800 [Pseudomonadota bacterium]
MKTFLTRKRFVGFALALTLIAQPVLSTLAPTQLQATEYSPPMMMGGGGLPGGGGGSTGGGWIVGGIFISVASIIACAAIVGANEGRELTAEEAWAAGLIPLSCLLALADDGE